MRYSQSDTKHLEMKALNYFAVSHEYPRLLERKKKRWRKITCNNLSLQSCGGTAAVFLYLSLSASRLRI